MPFGVLNSKTLYNDCKRNAGNSHELEKKNKLHQEYLFFFTLVNITQFFRENWDNLRLRPHEKQAIKCLETSISFYKKHQIIRGKNKDDDNVPECRKHGESMKHNCKTTRELHDDLHMIMGGMGIRSGVWGFLNSIINWGGNGLVYDTLFECREEFKWKDFCDQEKEEEGTPAYIERIKMSQRVFINTQTQDHQQKDTAITDSIPMDTPPATNPGAVYSCVTPSSQYKDISHLSKTLKQTDLRKRAQVFINYTAIKGKDGETMLHAAARMGQCPLVETLLNMNYLPNEPDKNGNTALHHAIMGSLTYKHESDNHTEVLRKLINSGADLTRRNQATLTPLELAEAKHASEDILQILRHADSGHGVGTSVPTPPSFSNSFFSALKSNTLFDHCGTISTRGDGNCAFNAIALGICELFEKDILGTQEQTPFKKFATELLSSSSIKQWLINLKGLRLKKIDSCQKIIAPLLRQVAIDYIEANYDIYYKTIYEEHLRDELRDYIRFRLGLTPAPTGDTFLVHQQIKSGFEAHYNTYIKKKVPKRFAAKPGKKTNPKETLSRLGSWWEKNEDNIIHAEKICRLWNNKERAEYFERMRTNNSASNTWGGIIEMDALATHFHLGIRYTTIQSSSRPSKTKPRILGIPYGYIPRNDMPNAQKVQFLCDMGIAETHSSGLAFKFLPEKRCNKLDYADEIITIITSYKNDNREKELTLERLLVQLQDKVELKNKEEKKDKRLLIAHELKIRNIFVMGSAHADAKEFERYHLSTDKTLDHLRKLLNGLENEAELQKLVDTHYNKELPILLKVHFAHNHWAYERLPQRLLKQIEHKKKAEVSAASTSTPINPTI